MADKDRLAADSINIPAKAKAGVKDRIFRLVVDKAKPVADSINIPEKEKIVAAARALMPVLEAMDRRAGINKPEWVRVVAVGIRVSR